MSKLEKQWRTTRAYLEQARRLLPQPVRENPGDMPDYDLGTLAVFQQSLDHNEFELALDQLEAVGELNSCPDGFWQSLEKAAASMGLDDRASFLRRRVNGSAKARPSDGQCN